MPISGTVPFFDLSTNRLATLVQVTVTGVEADGQATGSNSNETLQSFLQRVVNATSVSGVLDTTSGVTSGMQCVSGAVLSGIMQIQRECAMRYADLELTGAGNSARLQKARNSLAVNGEVQFGT